MVYEITMNNTYVSSNTNVKKGTEVPLRLAYMLIRQPFRPMHGYRLLQSYGLVCRYDIL